MHKFSVTEPWAAVATHVQLLAVVVKLHQAVVAKYLATHAASQSAACSAA